jgi:hypothetical protein
MDVLIWIALCKRISLQKSKNLGSALRRSKALKNCREFTKILKWLGSTGPGRSKRRRSCPRTQPESFQLDLKEIGFTSMSRDNSASLSFTGRSVRLSPNGDSEVGSETIQWLWNDTNKRLFVGCRLPAKLVVPDTTSGRIVSSCRRLVTLTTFSTMPADD